MSTAGDYLNRASQTLAEIMENDAIEAKTRVDCAKALMEYHGRTTRNTGSSETSAVESLRDIAVGQTIGRGVGGE